MTVTYQVAGGGHLDIDFTMTGPPNDRVMNTQHKKDTGTYSFTAENDGRYTYCFSNEMSTVTGKTVSFNVHGVMYVEDDGHTAPIEKEIRALSAALEDVKDEQEYIVVRERLHRDSTSHTPNFFLYLLEADSDVLSIHSGGIYKRSSEILVNRTNYPSRRSLRFPSLLPQTVLRGETRRREYLFFSP